MTPRNTKNSAEDLILKPSVVRVSRSGFLAVPAEQELIAWILAWVKLFLLKLKFKSKLTYIQEIVVVVLVGVTFQEILLDKNFLCCFIYLDKIPPFLLNSKSVYPNLFTFPPHSSP